MKNFICTCVVFFFLFSCSNDEFREVEQAENQTSLNPKAQYKRGKEVSKFAIDFIKEKTNNTLSVLTKKGKIRLNNSIEFTKSDELGTVDTSKEIVVINEDNTKHTFKVLSPSEPLHTITNLIVVEKGDYSYEYFIKYTFVGDFPINEETNTINFSKFNGTIETFNSSGDIIGSITIENEVITNDQGQLSPCPDDTQEPTDDTTNTGSNTGGSDSSTGIPNDDDQNDYPTSTGNGDPTQSSQFTDTNGDCGLTWAYEPCGCGGNANGHPPSGPDCCQGSPLVIRDCNGGVIAQRSSDASINLSKRDITDPCDDGDVGVILDEDVLCNLEDVSFNTYYSSKSPFNVDLSNVRKVCDSITLPDPSNEKFMCVYNKLIKSPEFKNLFNNVFGESKDINVTFKIVENIPNKPSNISGVCRTIGGHTDTNGNLLDLDLEILLRKSHIDNDSRISVAKTILHECIHAYLKLKMIDCSQGTNFGNMENTVIGELINEYNDGACQQGQGDHQFMFNFMVPTMQDMLSDVRDNLIPENHKNYVEGLIFQNNSNPVVPNTPWNWDQFYYYFCLAGLHNTTAFENEIASDPVKNYLFTNYTFNGNSFSNSFCQD